MGEAGRTSGRAREWHGGGVAWGISEGCTQQVRRSTSKRARTDPKEDANGWEEAQVQLQFHVVIEAAQGAADRAEHAEEVERGKCAAAWEGVRDS